VEHEFDDDATYVSEKITDTAVVEFSTVLPPELRRQLAATVAQLLNERATSGVSSSPMTN
jgi:hypothetical protein